MRRAIHWKHSPGSTHVHPRVHFRSFVVPTRQRTVVFWQLRASSGFRVLCCAACCVYTRQTTSTVHDGCFRFCTGRSAVRWVYVCVYVCLIFLRVFPEVFPGWQEPKAKVRRFVSQWFTVNASRTTVGLIVVLAVWPRGFRSSIPCCGVCWPCAKCSRHLSVWLRKCGFYIQVRKVNNVQRYLRYCCCEVPSRKRWF